MSFLHRIFPFLTPAQPAEPARPPAVLVEFVADRGRLEQELAELRTEVAAGEARSGASLSELVAATTANKHDLAQAQAGLSGRLDELMRELGKLGREQFRATTLLEGHDTALEELGDAWREYLDQREREVADLREALAEIEGRVRLGLVKDLLPVADALDESVRAAHELLPALRSGTRPGRSLFARLLGTEHAREAMPAGGDAAFESWLEGLLLVERRLLALLEREDVRPIPAAGEPFDPHRHLAVAVARDDTVPAGTIVREELRGYTIGDRVLRHAEVVVARGEDHE